MRIIFLLSSILWCIGLQAQSNTDKIEGYFSFDNACKAIDDSGNGSSGALVNDLSCACGIGDSSLRFDGVDDALYLVGPFADIFSTSDFTISFYFKAPNPAAPNAATQVIMSKQSGCNTTKAFWVRYAAQNRRITSSISENDLLIATVQAKLDPGPCWQLVTLTRSNTRYSIYINGVLRDSKTSAARIDLTSNATFKVGEPVCPLDQALKGDFDELRFHSKALNADDLLKYNQSADRILNKDTLIYLGNSFQINLASYCAEEFKWQPLNGVSDPNIAEPVITPTAPTSYSVQMVYPGECTANDTIFVNVIDPDSLDCNVIFIPNAFTPGASPGRNDRYGVSNPFAVDEFISFEIFDRWGGRVFNAETIFDTWDGTFNGTATNPGVFLYRLRYKCKGEEKVRAGNLTLLR
jgi:gliding motility-associated-like protein